MNKYRVTLTEEERGQLQPLVSTGKAAARKLTHARILLLADATSGTGHSDEQIADALQASLRTIARVRQRFVIEGIEAAVNRNPQPPRPNKIKIKGDIEQRLVQLACSDPPEGRCHWTLQLLADELVVLGMVGSISTETVRQALKKTISSRGSSRPGASRPKPTPSTSAHGGRDPNLSAALQPAVPGRLLRRSVQAALRRGATPRRCRSSRTAQVNYEYERKSVRHQLMMCEPLRSWRHVKVTEAAPGGTTPAVSGSWSRCTTPERRRSCWSRTT